MKPFLLITYILALFSYAQKPAFNPENPSRKFFEYAEYAQIHTKDFSIEDIIKAENIDFKDLNSENHDLGFTSDSYWLRFKLKNSSDTPKTYYLGTARPITDVVNLYSIANGIKIQRSG